MIWHVDFVKGEVRELTDEEHRRMVLDYQRRTKIKYGVIYIDCEPPEDAA